jgi:3-oxoacyl-[acyl-carrier protein] reductase
MLSGKVALVTGSARGIGSAVARALAGAGADVAVNYVRSRAEADALAAEIRATGRRAVAIRADVARPDEVTAMFHEVARDLGPPDILVNNAGPFLIRRLADTSFEEWRAVVEPNLYGVFLCSRAAIPAMRAKGWGRIVNLTVAPVEKHGAAPRSSAYHAAKAGVHALTKTLAAEEAPNGITVNAVGPGLIDGPGLSADLRDRLRAKTPLGRLGTAQEIARAVLFLVDPASSYVTGAHLSVAGGWEL